MNNDLVCYTFDAALEMAITMEEEGFRNYLAAIRQLTNKGAKDLLRENALDELNHKHQLEKALLDGRMDGGDDLDKPIPTMHLDYLLKKQELGPQSGVREALIYAIHLEKVPWISMARFQAVARGHRWERCLPNFFKRRVVIFNLLKICMNSIL